MLTKEITTTYVSVHQMVEKSGLPMTTYQLMTVGVELANIAKKKSLVPIKDTRRYKDKYGRWQVKPVNSYPDQLYPDFLAACNRALSKESADTQPAPIKTSEPDNADVCADTQPKSDLVYHSGFAYIQHDDLDLYLSDTGKVMTSTRSMRECIGVSDSCIRYRLSLLKPEGVLSRYVPTPNGSNITMLYPVQYVVDLARILNREMLPHIHARIDTVSKMLVSKDWKPNVKYMSVMYKTLRGHMVTVPTYLPEDETEQYISINQVADCVRVLHRDITLWCNRNKVKTHFFFDTYDDEKYELIKLSDALGYLHYAAEKDNERAQRMLTTII